jgi:hypothetical protein
MSDETCCGACGYPIHATKDKACDWCRQAADRIEALETKLSICERHRDAYAEMDRIGTQAVRDLEAKLSKTEGLLAKAVEALEYYAVEAMPWDADDSLQARATLAEIKGDAA